RDSVFWYGDMTFFDHLWSLLSQKKIHVSLTVQEPLRGVEWRDPTELAKECQSRVESHFQPISILNGGMA
ncbi:MAG: hypothetical protein KDD25_03970, partial [Bdellovibrionales bacterium]|nr:hypothetical protein [Bdellovibrionales bacterium]